MMFFVCLSNDKDRLVGSDSAREYSKILKHIVEFSDTTQHDFLKNCNRCIINFYESSDNFSKNHKNEDGFPEENIIALVEWHMGKLYKIEYFKDGKLTFTNYSNINFINPILKEK